MANGTNPFRVLGSVLSPAAHVALPQIRRAARRVNYPGMGRGVMDGAPRLVESIQPAELGLTMRAVGDLAQIDIMHAGALRRADSVFVASGMEAPVVLEWALGLYDELIPRLIAQEGGNVPAALGRLLGGNEFGRAKFLPSLEERSLRSMEAVLSLFSESITSGRPPTTLFDADHVHLLDGLAEFLRAHVVRYGHEHGLRHELTRMLEADEILSAPEFLHVLVAHQRRLPMPNRDVLVAASDSVFFAARLALNGEYKAYSSYARLLASNLSIGDGVVHGSEVLRQTVLRAMQYNRFGWLTPGPGHVLPASLELSDSLDLHSVVPFFYVIIDDRYLFNNGFAKISEFIGKNGNVPVNIMDLPAPLAVREMMVKIYGSVVDPGVTADNLWESGLTKFADVLSDQEELAKIRLRANDVVGAAGQELEVRLIPGSRGVQGLIDRAVEDGFIEAADEVNLP